MLTVVGGLLLLLAVLSVLWYCFRRMRSMRRKREDVVVVGGDNGVGLERGDWGRMGRDVQMGNMTYPQVRREQG